MGRLVNPSGKLTRTHGMSYSKNRLRIKDIGMSQLWRFANKVRKGVAGFMKLNMPTYVNAFPFIPLYVLY